jgi:hypothetical protein
VFAGFVMSLLIRNLFVIPWLAVFLISLFEREKKFLVSLGASGIIFAISFFLHYRNIVTSIPATVPGMGNLAQGSVNHLWHTLGFGAVLLSRPVFILGLVFVMFIISIVVLRRDYPGRILLASALVLPIVFTRIGPDTYRDYWGITYMPILMMCACYFLPAFEKFIVKNSENDSVNSGFLESSGMDEESEAVCE